MTNEAILSFHENIYRVLRSKIMLGQLEPGHNLTIRGLATEFNVSMTPIREATRRLAAEGALQLSNLGRISVPNLNKDRMQELFCLRSMLEPELASRAFPRVHSVLIERLETINNSIEQMIVQKNSEGYLKRDLEFHKTLYLRAQAPSMLALVETVWVQSGPNLKKQYQKNLRKLSTRNHHMILNALRIGNKDGFIKNIYQDVSI
jgi:DNA-binding GntR family transcriptional regulator